MLILGGCSDNGSSTGPTNTGPIEPTESTLRLIDNSEDFYVALREGLRKTAENSYYNSNLYSVEEVQAGEGAGTTGTTGDSGGATTGATEVPTADSSAQSTGVSGASVTGANSVTGTNVQEVGVDEQDRVKADNSHLYILTANSGPYAGLAGDFVEPAGTGTTGTTSTAVDVDIVGSSIYYPGPTENSLRILSFQPDAPDATSGYVSAYRE